jgi:hypothetical protein
MEYFRKIDCGFDELKNELKLDLSNLKDDICQ